MAKSLQTVLTRRERQIMDILYRRGRATASEVMADLSAIPHYSTRTHPTPSPGRQRTCPSRGAGPSVHLPACRSSSRREEIGAAPPRQHVLRRIHRKGGGCSPRGRPHSPTRKLERFSALVAKARRRDHDESAPGQHDESVACGHPGLGGVRTTTEGLANIRHWVLTITIVRAGHRPRRSSCRPGTYSRIASVVLSCF